MPLERRGFVVALAFFATLFVQVEETEATVVGKVAAIGMTVDDLERSVAFYTHVLGFEKASEVELAGDAYESLLAVFPVRVKIARLKLGGEEIELTDYLAPASRPFPVDSRGNDRSFQHIAIVVSDMDRGYAELRKHGVEHASSGPQTLPAWNRNAAGIRAFYFRDPDGHYLELIEFPPGKGDARWQARDRLFLGIDHTAIVVGDTKASLRFYRDALGLAVAGGSENHGIEQERLNAVRGAHLRITTLRAASGPGIELLEYLIPHDGRVAPADLRASDLLHWQTRVETSDVDAAERDARAAGGRPVSPGVVDLSNTSLGFSRAMLLRDPDGHALEIVDGTRAR